MLVLVGPPASGKTTWRRRLVADGYPPERVVSLDELRREVAARVEAAGGPVRSPEEWTPRALRLAARLRAEMLADGRGYLADATHLRRRERVVHVRGAASAGLPAVALLLPEVPLDVLRARNAGRSGHDLVPDDVLVQFAHRRALLSADLLREEGFAVVEDYGSAPR